LKTSSDRLDVTVRGFEPLPTPQTKDHALSAVRVYILRNRL